MGFLDFLKTKPNNRPFVSENAFISNRKKQIQLVPLTLKQLRELAVTADTILKLEFFFYTNTEAKAAALATEIKSLSYTVQYDVSTHDKKLFVVTGWSNKMVMTEDVIKQWTKQMCEMGYKFDCDFDGWGTAPD